MSEKTAKVAFVLNVREWSGNNGKIFYYKLEMDNGDIGEIGKKTENAFKVGDSLTYTIEEGQYGNKFKPVQQNGFSGANRGNFGGAKTGGNASFALAYSKDLMVKKLEQENYNADEIVKGTLWIADKFKAWLDENK